MRAFILTMAALAIAAAAASPVAAASTIYVMRHLQKTDGNDPPLSAEGAANAQRVVSILGKRKIRAIFATPTKRAVETGEPLAKALKLTVTSYDPKDPAALKTAVDAIKGAALIVGHSNTVPDIVALFGGERVGPLADSDYGTIFVVSPSPRPSPSRGDGVKVERIEISPKR